MVLRVKEALVKDVGRAVARIDPSDMKLFGLESGEVVMLEGKRSTPVKLMPCYPEDRNKSMIQIDGITRANAQTGIDERIKLVKIDPATGNRTDGDGIIEAFKPGTAPGDSGLVPMDVPASGGLFGQPNEPDRPLGTGTGRIY